MGIQEQGFIMNGVRTIFGFLDKLIYSLIKWILFGIFDLANLTTNSDVFNGIYQRLYVILGIFMAFKLSFTFFKYIIDPESMTGKSDRSLGKIFARTFVMLGALVLLPTLLFGGNGQPGILARAQKAFLPTLPKVIFGVNEIGGLTTKQAGDSSDAFTKSIEQASDDISITVLKGFFSVSPELNDVCSDKPYDKYPQIKSLDDFSNNLLLTCNRRGDIVIDIGITHTGTKYYVYSYMFFISTVVGVLVAGLLLGITLGIAKRIFKLLLLELIAPIPIMSLMDPKGSKDGAFSKWWKSLATTFCDIFLKLGIVYMVIVFIHLIVNTEGGLFPNFPSNSGFRGTYLSILLILGLIFFAKEAPKFLKESLGFKGEGGILDDVKSVGKAAGLVAGSGVAAVGTFGAFATNYRASSEQNKLEHGNQKVRNVLRNLGSGLGGAIGHQAVTTKALMGKNGGVKAVMEAAARRNARRATGSTWLGRRQSEISGLFTGDTPNTKLTRDLESIDSEQSLLKSIKARAKEEMIKSTETKGEFIKGSGQEFNYKKFKAAFDAASASGALSFVVNDVNGNSVTISTQDASENIGFLASTNEADYIANVGLNFDSTRFHTTKQDKTLSSYQQQGMDRGYGQTVFNRSAIGDRVDAIDTERSAMKKNQAKYAANDNFSKK